MSTIIAMNTPDEQALYTDSLSDGAGIAHRGCVKAMVIAPSCVMGWCGVYYVGFVTAGKLKQRLSLDDVFTYQGFMERLSLPDPDVRDFVALFLFRGKVWVMHEEMCPVELPGPFAARGSGAHFAIGALAAGATPWRALSIVSQYDVNTGGPFFRLDISGKMEQRLVSTEE